MIWIIGQYADRIENSDVLLDDFLYTFLEEPVEVKAKKEKRKLNGIKIGILNVALLRSNWHC